MARQTLVDGKPFFLTLHGQLQVQAEVATCCTNIAVRDQRIWPAQPDRQGQQHGVAIFTNQAIMPATWVAYIRFSVTSNCFHTLLSNNKTGQKRQNRVYLPQKSSAEQSFFHDLFSIGNIYVNAINRTKKHAGI